MTASIDRAAGGARQRPGGRWLAAAGLGWLVAFALAAAYVVLVHAPRERTRAVSEWQARLDASLDDRVAAIEEWIGDGLRGAGHVARFVRDARAASGNAEVPREIPPFESTSAADFIGWRVYRADGTVVGSSAVAGEIGSGAVDLARRTAPERIPAFELATAQARPLALFAAAVPAGDSGAAADVVVLALDPRRWLYPRLQREASPTATGETILVARSGDEVVFLSPLRHDVRPPGTVRLPITTPLLPSPLALAGAPVAGRFVDYRGAPVLAAARPIAGTRLAVVAKVDEREALAASRRHIAELLVFVAALLLAVGAGGIAVWRGSRAAHYKALAASHAEVAELFEHGPDAGLAITGGVITAANRAAGELFRCDPAALVGMTPWQLNPPVQNDGSSSESMLRGWIDALSPGVRRRFDWRCRRLDGSELEAEISISVVAGTPPRALAWLRDVTEERALRERLRLLVEGSSRFFFYVQELDGSLSYVSPSVEAITGRPPAAWIARRDWFTTASPVNDEARRRTRLHLGGEITPGPVLVEITHASGRPLMLEVSEFGRYSGRRLIGLHGIAHDVSERVRAEEALRHGEQRFRVLVDSLGEGVGVVDPDERFVQANPAAEAIFGVGAGELAGRDLAAFATPDSLVRIHEETRRRRAGETGSYDIEIVRPDGQQRTLLLTATPQMHDGSVFAGAFAIFRDVTDHRRLEARLVHAQKMEAVGRLAGGIAHDFNNLLQAMLGLSQSLALRAGDADQVRAAARELGEHVRRGAALARQLLLFSRRETTRFESVDLNALLERGGSLLRRLVRENVEVRIRTAPAPLPVRGDGGQLEQVLINLAVNAADAMPEGGTLTIEAGAETAGTVFFAVADTGHGVPEEIRSRIFEPFFTTKDGDRGTGLGLSVVHGIVAAHGGEIALTSEVGHGSTFRVRLPRARGRGAPPPPPVLDAGVSVPEVPAGVRILVVEDEPAARESLVELLGMLGYEVLAVASGEEAGLLPADPPFEVLLTDFRLPGVNGADLARGLADRWPDLKVVLMSGYTEDDSVRAAVLGGSVRFLQKPFSIEALAAELRAVSAGGRAS